MHSPPPIKTENIQLPDYVTEIIEQLAKSVHYKWSLDKVNQGWSHGENINEEQKTHPSLKLYDELPESEKEIHRSVVNQVLKSLYVLKLQITETL